jgi:acyl-CoA reductase-like NAD-dependent aldehyde dehydrogenase
VEAGKTAFLSWSKTPIEKRQELIRKFVELWAEYEKDFSTLITIECGKPRSFADIEATGIKATFLHHAALKLPEEKFEDEERVITTRYQPLGVVAAICPWNFPLSLAAGKIAPALLTGCTIIVKPSPFTPYSELKMVELANEIFPSGVVQALGGGDDLGPMLVDHPGVAKISFTGSISTGKRIMAACAKTLKRVTLELGGNDPCIVFPDVDLDKVVPQVTIGSFWNSAQVCIATKRIYIHESIYREFVDRMVAFAKTLKVGTSDEEGHSLVQYKMRCSMKRSRTSLPTARRKDTSSLLAKQISQLQRATLSTQPSSTIHLTTPELSKKNLLVPLFQYSRGPILTR